MPSEQSPSDRVEQMLDRGFSPLIFCFLACAAFGADNRLPISPEAILRQDGKGFPRTWGTNNGKPVVADYEMDPEVVTNAAYRGEMMKALSALPSLKLDLDTGDLFGSKNGIYANPKESGDAWERPCSVMFFPTNGSPGFAAGAGLRIQGGWNRRPEESPKHSFRLAFRKQYGTAKLKYP